MSIRFKRQDTEGVTSALIERFIVSLLKNTKKLIESAVSKNYK